MENDLMSMTLEEKIQFEFEFEAEIKLHQCLLYSPQQQVQKCVRLLRKQPTQLYHYFIRFNVKQNEHEVVFVSLSAEEPYFYKMNYWIRIFNRFGIFDVDWVKEYIVERNEKYVCFHFFFAFFTKHPHNWLYKNRVREVILK